MKVLLLSQNNTRYSVNGVNETKFISLSIVRQSYVRGLPGDRGRGCSFGGKDNGVKVEMISYRYLLYVRLYDEWEG